MSGANALPLPAEIDRLRRVNADLAAALDTAALQFEYLALTTPVQSKWRATLNGYADKCRVAIANAKVSA